MQDDSSLGAEQRCLTKVPTESQLAARFQRDWPGDFEQLLIRGGRSLLTLTHLHPYLESKLEMRKTA